MDKTTTDPDVLTINGHAVRRGKNALVSIPLPSLYDCSPITMPVHVIRGKKPGPVLCVTGAIHGDEINGVEIIRRLLAKGRLAHISGTLIAVPIVNVYGFLYRDRYLIDRRDLNRSFPGSPTGSLAGRLAHTLTSQIIDRSHYLIDLHTGSNHRSNLPQIRINGDREIERTLAGAFNAPVILTTKERENSLRKMAQGKGIPTLLYEAGEAHRFNEGAIKLGLQGVIKVMRALEMLPKKLSAKHSSPQSFFTCSSYWVRSPYSGVFRLRSGLGKKVKKGQIIAKVGNPFTNRDENIIAPHSGIVIGLNKLPLVHEGAALFHIACFEELTQVEEEIREFTAEYPFPEYFEVHTHLDNV